MRETDGPSVLRQTIQVPGKEDYFKVPARTPALLDPVSAIK
jgi:hypothetical protein